MGTQLLLDEESHHPTFALYLLDKEKGRGQLLLSTKLSVVRLEKHWQGEIPAEPDLSKVKVFCGCVHCVCFNFPFGDSLLNILDVWKQG